jgi:hypothetical protein
MTFADFLSSTEKRNSPPSGLSKPLLALWHDRRGEWDEAHTLAQDAGGKEGDWVHAYLHRKEGDQTNAAYWYRLAGRPVSRHALPDEWREIAQELLENTA